MGGNNLNFLVLGVLVGATFGLTAWAETTLSIGYLRVEQPVPPTLSNLDPIPEDNGVAGAQTGLLDNLTTGKFLGHNYEMIVSEVPEGDDPLAAAREMLAASPYIVIDAAADDLVAIADLPEAKEAMLFNISSGALRLRDEACRANLLHTVPSDAMRTDALAQVLVKKRWNDLVMITGAHDADQNLSLIHI